MGYVRPVLSQYRSHGYLFNPATTNISAQENSLNTVLTVISLIIQDSAQFISNGSQYRSHGYLFNLMNLRLNRKVKSLNTVLTVISLILDSRRTSVSLTVSIPFSRLSL